MSNGGPMSHNEERLWEEVNALKARLEQTLEGWRKSIEQTAHAMANTDRAIAQTEEAIALAKRFADAREPQHCSLPKEKS